MAKKVLITGGTKGIGLASLEKFLEAGFKAAVIARSFEGFKYADDPRVEKYVFDVEKIQEIADLAKRIGDVDVIVNNVGAGNHDYSYEDYPDDEADRIVKINVKAPLEFVRAYSDLFKNRRSGRIINVSSQASEIGHTDIWYGITKAGLVNLTKSLASEFGAYGVPVYAVSPGPVETDRTRGVNHLERFDRLVNRTYFKRIATAEEVAEVIFWLGSSAPEYISGENIDINNGAQRINLG